MISARNTGSVLDGTEGFAHEPIAGELGGEILAANANETTFTMPNQDHFLRIGGGRRGAMDDVDFYLHGSCV